MIDLIVPISGNKLFIKTAGHNPETVMTHEYPFEIETRLTVGLNKFLNYFISSIETPDKVLRNLTISVLFVLVFLQIHFMFFVNIITPL